MQSNSCFLKTKNFNLQAQISSRDSSLNMKRKQTFRRRRSNGLSAAIPYTFFRNLSASTNQLTVADFKIDFSRPFRVSWVKLEITADGTSGFPVFVNILNDDAATVAQTKTMLVSPGARTVLNYRTQPGLDAGLYGGGASLIEVFSGGTGKGLVTIGIQYGPPNIIGLT